MKKLQLIIPIMIMFCFNAWSQEKAKRLTLLNNFSEYKLDKTGLGKREPERFPIDQGKQFIFSNDSTGKNTSGYTKLKKMKGLQLWYTETFYENPEYFNNQAYRNNTDKYKVSTNREMRNQLFYYTELGGFYYYRNGKLFLKGEPNTYKESELGLYRLENEYEVFSGSGKSYFFNNITNTSQEYPFALVPYYFFTKHNWQQYKPILKGGTFYEKSTFFGYSTPKESGIIQFNRDRLEIVFKVNYETTMSFQVAMGIENAILVIKYQDASAKEIKTYLDENLQEVEPKPATKIVLNAKIVGEDTYLKVLRADGIPQSSDTIKFWRAYKDNANDVVIAEQRMLSDVADDIKRIEYVFDKNGVMIGAGGLSVDWDNSYSDVKKNYDPSTIDFYKEANFKGYIPRTDISESMKQIIKEGEIEWAKSQAQFGNLQLRNEFDRVCLGKGSACNACGGKGKNSMVVGQTKKSESVSYGDVRNGEVVKVTETTTTARDNTISSSCKSCNGTGNCSTNPGGKYTAVINQYYPGLCTN